MTPGADMQEREPLPPALLDHLAGMFHLEREVGRGGMATVWLARRRAGGEQVAIKILHPSLARALGVARFLREIRIASGTHSPHLVPLEDSGEVDGLPYYVMPFVAGQSLRVRLDRDGQLPIAEAVRVGREIAAGLLALHADGFVHRDIKPENILLRADGTALVADYGIARALTASATDEITSTGLIVGTPAYMSPEQSAGDPVDPRSDQYAWGCMTYEMLAGVPPFHGVSSQAVIARHRHDVPPSLRVVRPSIPEALEALIVRTMSKNAADRFADMAAMLSALDAIDLTDLRPATRGGRRRIAWLAGAAAIAAAAAGYVMLKPHPLDAGRVVVFPFTDVASGDQRDANQATILVANALEQQEPTRWLDGWSLLTEAERADRGGVDARRAARLTRGQGARYYLEGAIVRRPQSLRVVVRLHDLEQQRDTSVYAEGPASASAADLGLTAAIGLLPRLTGLEGVIDIRGLRGRKPEAVSDWLVGEREYRQSRMRPALQYLERAVAEDDLLAPAALRAATAANWIGRTDTARAMLAVALRNPDVLTARQAAFAQALRHYFSGNADSAVIALRRALGADDRWADAWMVLGEVYLHMLPAIALDSQALRAVPPPVSWPLEAWAEDAFKRALALDPGYTPPLAHLAEIAARRGDAREFNRFAERLRRANPDSLPLATLALIGSCLSGRRVDWRQEAQRGMRVVYRVGVFLQAATDPRPRRCARDAFRGVLAADPGRNQDDWSALFSLHGLLAAEGNGAEALAIADSAINGGMPAPLGLFVLDAAAGVDPGARADAFVGQLQAAVDTRPAPSLWLLTLWSARTGDTLWLQRVGAQLGTRVASPTATRLDSLMARVSSAYVALARHDTAQALVRFGALRPTAEFDDLSGLLWEPLAPERLTYARLLLSTGNPAAAHRVASVFDQPGILIYPLFLRESLQLRLRAARALGDDRLASIAESRLRSLADDSR